uniref:Butyrophilin subfamily 1 member A1 n=1 Tax=Nothoprocta perdicaria TaxID=30464 RepID=A0A8C7A028_NOTPE
KETFSSKIGSIKPITDKRILIFPMTLSSLCTYPCCLVTGVIGEEIVLPCRVVAEHVPEIFSVQWIFHEQSEKITVSRYDGKSKKEIQDERYQGRTYFFHSEFRAGNMSLHLKDIKNSDKGSYTCLVSFDNHQHDELIELEVAARGIVPSIFLKNYMKESISLSCHTEGWFPEPRVIWLDSQEQIRREPSTTKIMMMPAGLYSVVTSMNLEPGSDMEVSCRIVNRLLNTTSESRVLISDVFFPSISKWLVFFLVMLCLSLVLIFSTFCKLKSKYFFLYYFGQHIEISQQLILKPMTLDVDTAHPNLSFSEDRKSFKHDPHSQKVPHTERRFDSAVCVLGSEGFSSGNHYWEVEVEKSNDWDLGVARRSVQKKGVIYLSVKEGFWVMGSSLRDYWARTDPWTRVTVQRKPRKIGVYLSCEEKLLTFFNVTDMSVMFTFKDCAFSEEVYPFFKNSQKESTMRIWCPSPGTGCPGRLWSLLLWRSPNPPGCHSRCPCWSSKVGLDDL